jgi:trigger factor
MKNVHEIEIKLEKEWVSALDATFKKKNKETKIDGFRKGTAPKDVYLKHFGIESLYMDAVDAVITPAYKKALEQEKLIPVIEPSVDVIGISDTNVILKFTIITKPDVTLGEYKNLKVKKDKVTVTDEEVDDEIEHLRTHLADMIVKENGSIVNGDTAVLDFTGFVDGAEFEGGKGENFPLEIGSNTFIPGFEEGLIGLKVGDEKDLNLKFPENYMENLKGKDVTFKVKVNEVKTRVLPEIDEEFFKDLGYEDIKTVDEFKKRIKEEIMHEKEHAVDDEFVEKVLEKASSNMKIEINPEIIDDEVHRMVDEYSQQLMRHGMNIDEFYKMTGTTHEDLHKQMAPEAEKRVKYRYLLEAIAEKENIETTEEEVNARAEEVAQQYGMTVDEIVKAYGSMDVVKYDLKMHKALELLKENN